MREITRLLPQLIDRYTQGSQSFQVHQKVIHQILNLPVVMTAEHHSQSHTVYGTQRMVGHKSIFPGQIGNVLQAVHLYFHIQISQCVFTKVNTHITLTQILINKILMNETFEPVNQKTGNISGFLSGTRPYDVIKID